MCSSSAWIDEQHFSSMPTARQPRGVRRQAVRASQGIRLRCPLGRGLHGSTTDRETRKVLMGAAVKVKESAMGVLSAGSAWIVSGGKKLTDTTQHRARPSYTGFASQVDHLVLLRCED